MANSGSLSNNCPASASRQESSSSLLESREFPNPPYDSLSSGSIQLTTSSEIPRNPGSTAGRQHYVPATGTMKLIGIEEALEHLLHPKSRAIYHDRMTYRPSAVHYRNRTEPHLTATWAGELRIQNEALADENASSKERTIRDLERLTAAGTLNCGSRGTYNSQQGNLVNTCSADFRPQDAMDNDLRVPSFLRNRQQIPLRKMRLPGMDSSSGHSFASSADDSFIGMDFAAMTQYSNIIAPAAPPSEYSTDSSVSKGKFNALRNNKVVKCVAGLKSWKKAQRTNSFRETPAIREDRDYDYSNDLIGMSNSMLARKTACFMCLGGTGATRYSIDDSELTQARDTSSKSSDFKTILLTTSPLYGDVTPTPRSQVDDLAVTTQTSLNIAVTANPMTEYSSSVEDERDLDEIWDDESDTESRTDIDTSSAIKQWDSTLSAMWVPPTLKTDQEYEMYQLQSRMDAENAVRRNLRPSTPQIHRYTPDELVDTASCSSWDVKTAGDVVMIHSRRKSGSNASSWSDFGMESISTARSGSNNVY